MTENYEDYIERKAKGLIEISEFTQYDEENKISGVIPAVINKFFTKEGDEYFQKSPINIKILDEVKAKLQLSIAGIDQLKEDCK